MRATTLMIWIPAAAGALTNATTFGQATFAGLGTVAGGQGSQAIALGAGGAVGAWVDSGGGLRAMRWTPAGMEDLGVMSGHTFSQAFGASVDGATVVGVSGDVDHIRGFRWAAGVMVELAPLPGLHNSGAAAASGDGSVVVGSVMVAYESLGVAVRWVGGGAAEQLEMPAGAVGSGASCVSVDGGTIGGVVYLEQGGARAARWVGGVCTLLEEPPGGVGSVVYGMSGDGSALAGEYWVDSSSRAFVWTDATGMVGMEAPGGVGSAAATDVSDGGRVAVGIARTAEGERAVLWMAGGGAVDLNEQLPKLGVDLEGWVLTGARAVSADGRTIAGTGEHNGRAEAWIATIPADPACYANCDGSTEEPVLNVNDFVCFVSGFAAGEPAANCDGSTLEPVLNVNDFMCFAAAYAAGCGL